MAKVTKPGAVKGQSISPDEVAEMTELKALFKPADGIKRLEDFAKWLFGSTSIIGTLGAGFSNAALGQLVGIGKYLFTIALIFVGISLACAALSLAPKWVGEVNPNSIQSMLSAVGKQFKYRRRFLRIASVAFSLGLVLAAIAPFASNRAKQEKAHVSVNYTLGTDGKFETRFVADGLTPYAPVEIELKTEGSKAASMILPRSRSHVDTDGKASLPLTLSRVNKIKDILVITRWPESAEKMREDTLKIPVIQH